MMPLWIVTACLVLATALAHAGMWAVFTKAGVPGWKSLVPYHGWFVLADIAGRGRDFGWFGTIFDVAWVFGKTTGYQEARHQPPTTSAGTWRSPTG